MMANVKMFTDIVINVTVIGSPIENRDNVKFGMVIDFTDLKKIKRRDCRSV
jgi:6-pyruvoyl-tetrahydropterin synthase